MGVEVQGQDDAKGGLPAQTQAAHQADNLPGRVSGRVARCQPHRVEAGRWARVGSHGATAAQQLRLALSENQAMKPNLLR